MVNKMGCTVGKKPRPFMKATAIEILNEDEYNLNPEGACKLKVETDGKIITVHYRKLNYTKVKSESKLLTIKKNIVNT